MTAEAPQPMMSVACVRRLISDRIAAYCGSYAALAKTTTRSGGEADSGVSAASNAEPSASAHWAPDPRPLPARSVLVETSCPGAVIMALYEVQRRGHALPLRRTAMLAGSCA